MTAIEEKRKRLMDMYNIAHDPKSKALLKDIEYYKELVNEEILKFNEMCKEHHIEQWTLENLWMT